MKKIYLIGVWLVGMSVLFGQTSTDARKLLDEVSQQYKSMRSFYMSFESELNNPTTGNKSNYSGDVYVQK